MEIDLALDSRYSTVVTSDSEEAAAFVRKGELVAFPTETVYGLGADATNAAAVARIYRAKNRPADNPLIVHAADLKGVYTIAKRVPKMAEAIFHHFSPGPITVILTKKPGIPDMVTAGLPTVGIRIPDHKLARMFIRDCGVPLAAPSANLSGRPSPTTWRSVLEDLDGRIACILRGGKTRVGLESTVIDCTGPHPVVLREGGTTLEELARHLPFDIHVGADPTGEKRSPGTRYPHYAPRASVALISDPNDVPALLECAYIGLDAHPVGDRLGLTLVVLDPQHYAQQLFEFFRTCDRAGIRHIYCQTVPRVGIGSALMDRLERATSAGTNSL